MEKEQSFHPLFGAAGGSYRSEEARVRSHQGDGARRPGNPTSSGSHLDTCSAHTLLVDPCMAADWADWLCIKTRAQRCWWSNC